MSVSQPSRPNLFSRLRRREAISYLLRALAVGGVAYAIFYFPYPEGSLPLRALTGYLRLVARASAIALRPFDHTVMANGDLVDGRFSLRIVLDCAALDAHALFAAAVLAFPAPVTLRLWGVAAGGLGLAGVNVGRIVILYIVGVCWPAAFHWMHEEILQLGIVLAAFSAFLAWVFWAQRLRSRA
jgi:exosortase/archaeosortase family protein